jgi:cbb3-type cytochrome oxidase subunit 1
VIGHLALSLVLAAAAVAVLVNGLRHRPSRPVWSLFVVFFLAIWAGGVWVAPVGPTHFGVTWLPFLMIAILLAVLVVVLAPPGGRGHGDERELEREVEVGLGMFFWVLIGTLLAAILAGYR